MNKVLDRIPFKAFLAFFFAFFLYEYGLPILKFMQLAEQNGVSYQELFDKYTQVKKHTLRLPIYFMTYAVVFYFITKGKNWAFQLQRILLILHLILKPLTIFFALYVLLTNEQLMESVGFNVNIVSTIGWAIVIMLVYGFSIVYLNHYWKTHHKHKAK